MIKKICKICEEIKDIELFVKRDKETYKNICSKCQNTRNNERYHKNIDLNREKNRIQKQKERDKDRVKCNIKRREYYKHKMKTDPLFKLKKNLRKRLWEYTKFNGKSKTTFEIIGITVDKLKILIEDKFTNGMTWENYGPYGWHIDHIIPLDSAKTEKELYDLNRYTNLQPMWWNENIRKGSKI